LTISPIYQQGQKSLFIIFAIINSAITKSNRRLYPILPRYRQLLPLFWLPKMGC